MNNTAIVTSADAKLPATYEAAQHALAECSRIDECKQWADKAEALASYSRQAKDNTLHSMALRIQSRAMRRAGELLKQIEPAAGARTDLGPPPARGSDNGQLVSVDALVTRTQAAADAGLSDRQRKTALRIASVPERQFEAAVERPDPPTVTELARLGTKQRPQSAAPLVPPDYAGASDALGRLRDFAVFCGAHDPATVALAIRDPDIARGFVQTIDRWLDRFVTNLPDPADDSEDAA